MLERDMRIAGAVNLLTSFPPLANALIIARYAWQPLEEARLRGWPEGVVDTVREVLSRAPEEVIELVLSRLERVEWFAANYSDMVYHDAVKGVVAAEAAYNYLRGLEDLGVRMYRRVLCIPLGLAGELARLGGSGFDEIRRADIAFLARVYPETDEDEPEYGEWEDYACSPRWALKAIDRLSALMEGGGESVAKLESTLRRLLEEGNSRSYAFIRAALLAGVKATLSIQGLLEKYEGEVEDVEGLLSLKAGIPALNYSLRRLAIEALRRVEAGILQEAGVPGVANAEWDGDAGGFRVEEGLIVLPEALPTLYLKHYKGPITVMPPSQNLVEEVLREAGASYKILGHSQEALKLIVEGYK